MKNNHALMASLLEHSYLEIVPVPGIEDRLMQLPARAYVAITCSPTKGVDATMELVERLASQHLRLVPHIAARMVLDRHHLQDILQRLTKSQIESVFVPGGDAPGPLGIYSGSLDLLRDMAEIGHTFKHIGVAAHPEGHPLISESQLLQLLLEKQVFANYLVTQMCFDPAALIHWLQKMRKAGVTLPAWIGLPGVADRARLFKLSTRIGVGQSARFCSSRKDCSEECWASGPIGRMNCSRASRRTWVRAASAFQDSTCSASTILNAPNNGAARPWRITAAGPELTG